MKVAYLLYSCDAWHTDDSLCLIGVFTTPKQRWRYLSTMLKKKKLTEDDWVNLQRYKQTQGRELNYLFEAQDVNPKYEEE